MPLVSAITVRSCWFLDLSLRESQDSTYDVRTAMARVDRAFELPKHALPQNCKVSNLPPPPGVVPGREAELACREQAQDIRFAADAACRRHRRRLVAARRDRHKYTMMTARSLTPPDTPYYWWLNKAVDFATSGAGASRSCCGRLPATWPTQRRPGRARSQH